MSSRSASVFLFAAWLPSTLKRVGAKLIGSRVALDWRSTGSVPSDSAPRTVDVIVPVHGAPEDFRRCLASLQRHTDLESHRLIVVEDASRDPKIGKLLEALERDERINAEILRNSERRGFVKSVNRAMAFSRRDVVLLNSDTVVTSRWLDKMQRAAYSASEIATVTPFSNDATICSLPRPLEANEIPAGYDIDSFASLVERCAACEYPRIPSGVGMCIYIKRKALDHLGLFNPTNFGLGYGEENEFCLRALKAGYVHVLDDATFIYHAGQRSFGASSREHKTAAHRVLRRFQPEYLPTVARFLEEDPLRSMRERVIDRLQPVRRFGFGDRGPPFSRVLHVVHGWPPWSHAGTELYTRWLALHQAKRRDVMVYARIADTFRRLGEAREYLDHGVRVRLTVNNFLQRNPLSRSSLHDWTLERDFAHVLDEFRPDLLHVHHLAGHTASLVPMAGRRGIPILYQIQDWWPACARVNFTHRDHFRCSGPAVGKCARCISLTRQPPTAVWNRLLHLYRRFRLKRVLRWPEAYVMGSRFIEQSYRELGFLRPSDRVFVRGYGVPLGGASRPQRTVPGSRRPLCFGYVGSILPHKGLHVAVDAFRNISPQDAEFEIWGDASSSPSYSTALQRRAGSAAVVLRGIFQEEDKAGVLSGLDALVVPSIGLESFGLVAREAMAVGTPVIAARGSALSEMFEEGMGGTVFEPCDPNSLHHVLRALIERPQTLAHWARDLPPVKSAEDHAKEIEQIYEELEASRDRGRDVDG